MTSTRRAGQPGPGITLVVLLVGAGVGLVASGQPWWQAGGGGAVRDGAVRDGAVRDGAVRDGVAVTFSGSDVTGGLCQALAAVALAGVLLFLVLRVRGRRILAVALAATGAGMIAAGALRSAPDADAVRSRVRQVTLSDQFALSPTGWPWLYAVAGLVVLAGAVLLWLGAPRWRGRPSRFDRSAPTGSTPDPTTDPGRAWKDLDAGLDPTDDPEPRRGDPDVRPGEEGVTMDHSQDQRRE